jgi:hypothetical protein
MKTGTGKGIEARDSNQIRQNIGTYQKNGKMQGYALLLKQSHNEPIIIHL